MKKTFALAVVIWICAVALCARPQQLDDADKEGIIKSVGAYLYGEESGAKKEVLIDSVETIEMLSGSHCKEVKPDSESAIEINDSKNPKSQRAIVRIDVKRGWGVATIYKAKESDARCQQLWLSKVKGVWKINTILLPEMQ